MSAVDVPAAEPRAVAPKHAAPLLALTDVTRRFGEVVALDGVSMELWPAEVLCLLGDNGAGKSTLIKILSGVHLPTAGEMRVDGRPVRLASPRQALDAGIATVYQDLALAPLMSVTRNYFLGREPTVGWGPLRRFDFPRAHEAVREGLGRVGMDLDPRRPVGTLSGGQRQCVAIARALHFGARVLILDEPTSALGVQQSELVLQTVEHARAAGTAIILITHNVHHALRVGDRFTVLARGSTLGTWARGEVGRGDLLDLMSGTAPRG